MKEERVPGKVDGKQLPGGGHEHAPTSTAIVPRRESVPSEVQETWAMKIMYEAAVRAYSTKLLALKDAKAAADQVDATYEDALKMAGLLFNAYARLGELVEKNTASPKDSGRLGGKGVQAEDSLLPSVLKMAQSLGKSRRFLEDMKTIHRNREFIPLVIEAATKEGRLPTRTELLALIRAGSPARKCGTHKIQGLSKHRRSAGHAEKHASQSVAEKCSSALSVANACMNAVVQHWHSISDAEKQQLNIELVEMQAHLNTLRERYAPHGESA
jgi:hypothetical protein